MEQISCGAVVWRNIGGLKEVLLIKQHKLKDSWGIPKGHIMPAESIEECAIREVHEETGVLLSSVGERMPDVESTYNNTKKKVISFLTEVTDECVIDVSHPDCEVADAKWFPVNELPTIHYYQRPLVQHVLNEYLLK